MPYLLMPWAARLAVDPRIGRDVGQRNTNAHVQLQFRQARLFARKHRGDLGAGDDAVGRLVPVRQHGGAGSLRDVLFRHPGLVVGAGDPQPLAVFAPMHDGDRSAREKGAFLKPVDIGLAFGTEDAQPGREGAQGGARQHQAEAHRRLLGNGVQRERLLQ